MDNVFDFFELRVHEKRLQDVTILGLDIETTGLTVSSNEIIEIGIAEYSLDSKKISPVYQSYVKPEQLIKEFITEITGISDKTVRSAPGIDEVKEEVLPILKGSMVVAHNAEFDVSFLQRFFGETFLAENDIAVFDTLKFSRKLINSSRYSLEFLIESLQLGHDSHHRALDDAVMCLKLFNYLLENNKGLYEKNISELLQLVK